MVALQIRHVDEDVRDVLAARARAKGQSLQAYLLEMVEDDARRATNLAILNRFSGRGDGASPPAGAAAAELRDLRAVREASLASAPGTTTP